MNNKFVKRVRAKNAFAGNEGQVVCTKFVDKSRDETLKGYVSVYPLIIEKRRFGVCGGIRCMSPYEQKRLPPIHGPCCEDPKKEFVPTPQEYKTYLHYLDELDTQNCFCTPSADDYTDEELAESYEAFIRESEAFKELVKMKEQGYNLNIVGKNIVSIDSSGLKEAYDYYEFDHEMYLFSILTLEKKDLPWRK